MEQLYLEDRAFFVALFACLHDLASFPPLALIQLSCHRMLPSCVLQVRLLARCRARSGTCRAHGRRQSVDAFGSHHACLDCSLCRLSLLSCSLQEIGWLIATRSSYNLRCIPKVSTALAGGLAYLCWLVDHCSKSGTTVVVQGAICRDVAASIG